MALQKSYRTNSALHDVFLQLQEADVHFTSIEEAIRDLWKAAHSQSGEDDWLLACSKSREAIMSVVRKGCIAQLA